MPTIPHCFDRFRAHAHHAEADSPAISRKRRRKRLLVVSLKPFEQIVAEYGPAVLRICRAVVGRQEAEDVWSETFLAALRAYPQLDPTANIEAWLVQIAKRKAIDQHRAAARRPVPVDEIPEPVPGNAITGSAGLNGFAEPADEELWSALKALPLKQREAIAYHHLAGLPYAQVAAVLGNSEAAARRAAADGIRTLRRTYQKEPS